jgi:hypothetical protein
MHSVSCSLSAARPFHAWPTTSLVTMCLVVCCWLRQLGLAARNHQHRFAPDNNLLRFGASPNSCAAMQCTVQAEPRLLAVFAVNPVKPYVCGQRPAGTGYILLVHAGWAQRDSIAEDAPPDCDEIRRWCCEGAVQKCGPDMCGIWYHICFSSGLHMCDASIQCSMQEVVPNWTVRAATSCIPTRSAQQGLLKPTAGVTHNKQE